MRDEPGLLERLGAEARAARTLVPEADEVARRHLEAYEEAATLSAPALEPAAWFEERMGTEALAEWDRALALRSPSELGLA